MWILGSQLSYICNAWHSFGKCTGVFSQMKTPQVFNFCGLWILEKGIDTCISTPLHLSYLIISTSHRVCQTGDGRCLIGSSYFAMGKLTVMQVPSPGTELRSIFAPWRRAACLTMDRPRPVPPSSLERLLFMR